jgi:hypothetical protein
MTAFQGTPPGFHAGDMSHHTVALRPDIGLAKELVEAIRRERKKGQEPTAIAATLTLPRGSGEGADGDADAEAGPYAPDPQRHA